MKLKSSQWQGLGNDEKKLKNKLTFHSKATYSELSGVLIGTPLSLKDCRHAAIKV